MSGQGDIMKILTEASKSDKGFIAGLMDNPIFGAGVGVAALGLAVTLARRGAMSGLLFAERHFTTSLEIPSKDRSYHWVLQWINAHTKGNTRHIGVETRVTQHENGSHTTSFDFVPAPGKHFIWFKRNLIQIEREREKSMVDLSSGTPWETVKLTHFGRSREIFNELLDEARQQAVRKEEGKVVVYMPMMTDWRPFGRPRPRRPLESVILDKGLSEHLVTDIKEFHSAGKWYQDRGIPHRRGYLLYGPPGSGKTSFIQALAGDMGHNICVLNLNDRGLTDDRLLHLMTDVPPRSFVLLEDIDAVFNKRETAYSVTFSGLLNALDGVTSVDERIVFMTTNHLDRLDPALIRPGRVDCKVYVGHSTPHQQYTMFRNFYPEYTDAETEQYIANGQSYKIKATSGTPAGFEDTRATATEEIENMEIPDEEKPKFEPNTVTVDENGEKIYNFSYKRGMQKIIDREAIDEEDYETREEVQQAMSHLFDENYARKQNDILAKQFVATLDGVDVSMAELQGLMMIYKDQPRACIKAAKILHEQKIHDKVSSEPSLEYQKHMQNQAAQRNNKDTDL